MAMTQVIPVQDPRSITSALAFLRAGELVAFPTDTVYGLGADLYNPDAIQKLYIAKGRDAGKAIAVLIGTIEDMQQVTGEMPAEMQGYVRLLAHCFWPGPLTVVVTRHPGIPGNLSPLPTAGVRMPDLAATLELLNASGPLAVTSANLSGERSATSAEEVLEQLGGRIALIIDGGQIPGGLPSTVLDCTRPPPVILRPGPISQEEIDRCLNSNC
jgi:L-threonylcarbamoyladenylate synthase